MRPQWLRSRRCYFRGHPLWGEMDNLRKEIPLVISDINVGFALRLCLSIPSGYTETLWEGGRPFQSLVSWGASAVWGQMISYELSLGLSLVPVVMLVGSFSLVDIVNAQASYPFLVVPAWSRS